MDVFNLILRTLVIIYILVLCITILVTNKTYLLNEIWFKIENYIHIRNIFGRIISSFEDTVDVDTCNKHSKKHAQVIPEVMSKYLYFKVTLIYSCVSASLRLKHFTSDNTKTILHYKVDYFLAFRRFFWKTLVWLQKQWPFGKERTMPPSCSPDFVPVALEILWPVNAEGLCFLDQIGDRLTAVTRDPWQSSFLYQWLSLEKSWQPSPGDVIEVEVKVKVKVKVWISKETIA